MDDRRRSQGSRFQHALRFLHWLFKFGVAEVPHTLARIPADLLAFSPTTWATFGDSWLCRRDQELVPRQPAGTAGKDASVAPRVRAVFPADAGRRTSDARAV